MGDTLIERENRARADQRHLCPPEGTQRLVKVQGLITPMPAVWHDDRWVLLPSGASATPGFAATPRFSRAVVSATTTDKTGATTTNIVDGLTGVAAGTKIEEVVFQAVDNPGDGTFILFVHNGTDYRMYYDYDTGDPTAASNSVAGYRIPLRFDSFYLPSTSYKNAFGATVLTSGNVICWTAGADL